MNRHARITRQKDRDHHEEYRSNHDHQSRHRCGTGRSSRAGEGRREQGRQPEESRAQGQHSRQGCRHQRWRSEEGSQRDEASKPAPAKKTTAPRAESKGAKIIEMIGRAKGATLAEIMKATDWQAHSVRGFLSTAGKKQSLKIESTKNEAGERIYKTVK
jgi:hypothetical protein